MSDDDQPVTVTRGMLRRWELRLAHSFDADAVTISEAIRAVLYDAGERTAGDAMAEAEARTRLAWLSGADSSPDPEGDR